MSQYSEKDTELLSQESIFMNKISLSIIIIIIILGLGLSYYVYDKGTSEIKSNKELLLNGNPSEKVEELNKNTFLIKMEERVISETIKTLSLYNDGKIKLCKSVLCNSLTGKLEYKKNLSIEEEFNYFKTGIVGKYKVTESKYNSAFNLSKPLIKLDFINPENFEILILESEIDYFIVFVEKLDNQKNIFINKSKLIEEYISRINHLSDISSIESKLLFEDVIEIKEDLKKSLEYSFVYTIPKSIFENNFKLNAFIGTYLENGDSNKIGLELIQDKDTNFDLFNKELSNFLEYSIIDQISQKSDILIKDLRENKKEERLKEAKFQEKLKEKNNN